MKKYIVYLKNGGKTEENDVTCIIVRNDCFGGNIVNFMHENKGYSSLSERDIMCVAHADKNNTYVNLREVAHMNTDQFCNFLKDTK